MRIPNVKIIDLRGHLVMENRNFENRFGTGNKKTARPP